jgi:hypothetical protein
LENTQEEEKEAKETLKALQQNFAIMDGTLTQMVEEMKNAVVCHEEALTTTLVRHKEEMELVMKFVATLVLGLRPRQRGRKSAGQEEAWESHHILLRV